MKSYACEDYRSVVQKPTNWRAEWILAYRALVGRLSVYRMRSRTRRELGFLSDAQLADLGIDRVDAENESVKPFWRP